MVNHGAIQLLEQQESLTSALHLRAMVCIQAVLAELQEARTPQRNQIRSFVCMLDLTAQMLPLLAMLVGIIRGRLQPRPG